MGGSTRRFSARRIATGSVSIVVRSGQKVQRSAARLPVAFGEVSAYLFLIGLVCVVLAFVVAIVRLGVGAGVAETLGYLTGVTAPAATLAVPTTILAWI